MEWQTPFGHYYGTDEIENNGSFFAKDIHSFPDVLRHRCVAREADGTYLSVMKKYMEILNRTYSDPEDAYYNSESVIELIECESYLAFSENNEVRTIYAQLCEKCSGLYNAYMTVVR